MNQEHSKALKNTPSFAHKAQTRVRISREDVEGMEDENVKGLGELRSLNRS